MESAIVQVCLHLLSWQNQSISKWRSVMICRFYCETVPIPLSLPLYCFLSRPHHCILSALHFFSCHFIWLVLSWALPSYLMRLSSLILLPFMCPFPLSNVFLSCPSYKQPPTDPYMPSGCLQPTHYKHHSPPGTRHWSMWGTCLRQRSWLLCRQHRQKHYFGWINRYNALNISVVTLNPGPCWYDHSVWMEWIWFP